jgi:hypothetical protein
MEITQWYEILGVIGAIFVGVLALLVLVVYLEQWLARPDPPTPVSTDEKALRESGRVRIEPWAPDPSVQADAPYLPPAIAPGLSLGLDLPGTRAAGQLFTLLPPNTGQQ